MTALRKHTYVTEEDYLAGELESEIKHEFLGGVVYAMAGAKNRHNRIAVNTIAALHAALRGAPCDVFNSDTKVRIKMRDHTRFYYPDAIVVCDANGDDDTFQDRPVVLIEVASDSTRRIDEGEKKDAYLTISCLQTYLIVDQDEPTIVAWHRRPDSGFERVVYEGNDAVVPLPEVETEFPMAALFEGPGD